MNCTDVEIETIGIEVTEGNNEYFFLKPRSEATRLSLTEREQIRTLNWGLTGRSGIICIDNEIKRITVGCRKTIKNKVD
jgi:hypothetical protein